jgi:hypothetical protein
MKSAQYVVSSQSTVITDQHECDTQNAITKLEIFIPLMDL